MRIESRSAAWFLVLILAITGCVPFPVSTVPLHPRQERPICAESVNSPNSGIYSALTFDASGTLLAAYDSGEHRVRILRGADLTTADSLEPSRWPRRLGFSPGGRFLVIETHQGWVEDYLRNGTSWPGAPIGSAAAFLDDIQRVEVWNLRTGQTTPNLSCDAVGVSEPVGGWLWAKNTATAPGYRSSAILAAHFSADERIFSVLCWNGLRGLTTAGWLAQDAAASQSADGRIAILRVREKSIGFPTTCLWDQSTTLARPLPGDCATRLQPVQALSADGRHVALALLEQVEALVAGPLPTTGSAISRSDLRLWSLDSGKELVALSLDDMVVAGDYFRGVDLVISPDSAMLAVGGRRIRLYHMNDLIGDSP